MPMLKLMMKSGLIAVLLTAGGGHVALAHPNHVHPAAKPEVDEAGAKARAQAELERLLSVKKIDATWKDVPVSTVEKKQMKKRWEWLVTFDNPAPDAKKKTLYVFLKPSGDFVAANFTGK
jgi:hypothetical protein